MFELCFLKNGKRTVRPADHLEESEIRKALTRWLRARGHSVPFLRGRHDLEESIELALSLCDEDMITLPLHESLVEIHRVLRADVTFRHDDGRIERRGFRVPWELYQFKTALLDWFEDHGVVPDEAMIIAHPDRLTERALAIEEPLKLRLKRSTVEVRHAH